MSRVVVIGAGLAGLSAACRIAAQGHDVTVIERDREIGGRAGVLRRDGFTFDTGPTVLTMPELIDDTLKAAGSSLAERLTLRRLDPAYRARFADDSVIDVRADPTDMLDEIARTCGPDDAASFRDFIDWLTALYELELPHFIDVNYRTPLDLLRSPGAASRLIRMRAFGRLGPTIGRRFSDPRLQRLLSFQALYAGLSPEQALALYAVITYMDTVAGVWFPEGGMHALPRALAEAFIDAGGELLLDQPVTGLITDRNGRVAGVRTEHDRLTADAVVCTLDPAAAYRLMVPDLRPPRTVRSGRYAPSALVWHVGVRGLPDSSIRHHNIHFGHSWEGAFGAMIRRGELMPDPSRLVSVPSLDEPSMAPPGCSTLYVLEPVPHLGGSVDWRREAEPMRHRLLQFLSTAGYPTDIVTEKLITPLDWYRQGLAHGTPFSLAHTFGQTGPFRPPNHLRRRPGLYFAGSGTVPGVGVPMVILSGKLAAERVGSYLGSDRANEAAQPQRGAPWPGSRSR
ncbi:MAG TPA: phytoene desaturase family protein [Microlunatus sp.]